MFCQAWPAKLAAPVQTFIQNMKKCIIPLFRLAGDLPGLCILLQSCVAIGLAVALGWLFVTSELGRF